MGIVRSARLRYLGFDFVSSALGKGVRSTAQRTRSRWLERHCPVVVILFAS